MPSCKKMMMAHNCVARFCAKKGYFCMHEMNKDGKGKGVFPGMSNRLYIFGHVEYKLIRVNVESTFVSRLIKNEMKIVIQEPKFIESRKTLWICDRSFQAEIPFSQEILRHLIKMK